MGMELIIQVIAGLVGGNAAGAGMKGLSLGTTGNSVVGAVGGLVAGYVAPMLTGTPLEGMDVAAIIQSVVAGGAGGAVLTAIAGAVKKAVAK